MLISLTSIYSPTITVPLKTPDKKTAPKATATLADVRARACRRRV